METWQILVTVGVPSGIFGFAVWLIERKIEQHERKRTEEAKKRENIEARREKSREELQICIYETSLAAIALGEATAKARAFRVSRSLRARASALPADGRQT